MKKLLMILALMFCFAFSEAGGNGNGNAYGLDKDKDNNGNHYGQDKKDCPPTMSETSTLNMAGIAMIVLVGGILIFKLKSRQHKKTGEG